MRIIEPDEDRQIPLIIASCVYKKGGDYFFLSSYEDGYYIANMRDGRQVSLGIACWATTKEVEEWLRGATLMSNATLTFPKEVD